MALRYPSWIAIVHCGQHGSLNVQEFTPSKSGQLGRRMMKNDLQRYSEVFGTLLVMSKSKGYNLDAALKNSGELSSMSGNKIGDTLGHYSYGHWVCAIHRKQVKMFPQGEVTYDLQDSVFGFSHDCGDKNYTLKGLKDALIRSVTEGEILIDSEHNARCDQWVSSFVDIDAVYHHDFFGAVSFNELLCKNNNHLGRTISEWSSISGINRDLYGDEEDRIEIVDAATMEQDGDWEKVSTNCALAAVAGVDLLDDDGVPVDGDLLQERLD